MQLFLPSLPRWTVLAWVIAHPVIIDWGNQIQIMKMKHQKNKDKQKRGIQNLRDNHLNNRGAAQKNMKLANNILFVDSKYYVLH